MAIKKNFNSSTKTLTLEFTTIASLLDYVEQPTNECFKGKDLSSQQNGSWSGTETYQEAVDYLKYGWSTKSEVLNQKLKLAKQNAPTISRRKVYQSVVGYTPIVPNFLMGVPTNMLNSKLTTIKQKVVTINKDISYNWSYSEKDIEENSVKAFQIVQALEASGVRCNLNIIFGDELMNAKNVKRLVVKVRVKSSNEKMNISKTSFPMVNPGMLRRIFFRLIETTPEFKKEDEGICRGYGSAMSPRNLKSLVEQQNQYYLDRNIDNVEEEAKNFTK